MVDSEEERLRACVFAPAQGSRSGGQCMPWYAPSAVSYGNLRSKDPALLYAVLLRKSRLIEDDQSF